MPGTLLREKAKLGRSDSESSQESKKVSFNKNIRIKPFRDKYASNGSGVTRVNLNGLSRAPPPRLDNDILVNRFARRVDDGNEIDYLTPRVNNRYVTRTTEDNGSHRKSYLDSDVRSKSKSKNRSTKNGGDSWRTHPSQKPATPPDVQRNHVWNIVNQFDQESKQKYVCQQTDSDGEGSSAAPAQTNGDLDMNKSKKNPIANGIKVIFGLKPLKKQEESTKGKPIEPSSFKQIKPIDSDRSKVNGFVGSSETKGSKLNSSGSDLQDRSKNHGDRLGLLKTATENSRKGKKDEMTTRALSPEDVTDGYSTSKTFEYYDSKGLDDYDTIREEYLTKYRDPYGSWRGSPDVPDYRYEDDEKPPTPPRNANLLKSTGNISTEKTRLANGAAQYVFRSSDALNRESKVQEKKASYVRNEKRDLYKSTGDLDHRQRHYYDDTYGSQPDIRYKNGYSDDDRSPSPQRERLTREYPTIMENDASLGYRRYTPSPHADDELEREGDPLPRETRLSDNRHTSMERLRRAPSNDLGSSRPPTRDYGTLDSTRMYSSRESSPDIPPLRRYRHGSSSSNIISSGDKYRSWERRAKERGSVHKLFTGDEPTYSTIDKKNKVNRQLHYPSGSATIERESRVNRRQETVKEDGFQKKSGSTRIYVDNDTTYERPTSRNRSAEDSYYDSTKQHSTRDLRSSREDVGKLVVDRYRSTDRTRDQHDRSSSEESVQRQTESSHLKQVIQDGEFDHTIEEEKYNDVTLEKADNDTDTEEVVDVTADVKTEEYEKDGHYHKNHKQSKVETKTFTYTNPDIVETLRKNSKQVHGDRRITDKPYSEDIYGRRRQIDFQNKPLRDLADVKTSIEKSTDGNSYREGTKDITDQRAINRAIVETGTIDRENVKDGHRDTVVRDRNDYNRTVDNRFTYDDSDPMRKLRTNATVDQVNHYRTIDEKKIVETMEKKPSLARSRQQLKQIDAPEKPPRASKSKQFVSSIGQKFKLKREKEVDVSAKKGVSEDAVYTRVKKTSKVNRKVSGDRSSDDEHYRSSRKDGGLIERESSNDSLHKVGRDSNEGRYRNFTHKVRHVSSDHPSDGEYRKSKTNMGNEKYEKRVTKTYHEPVEVSIEKNASNGWKSQRKQVYTAGDSSSPSPPLHKRSVTLENRKSKSKLFGKRGESTERKPVSRTNSSAIDEKDETSFHHFKQYKGKHSPMYPSIRITLPGKENGEMSDGQISSKSKKHSRSKLPMPDRHGSVDRLEVPPRSGYHSTTLQHSKKSNGLGMKRSNSSAATMPPVQRLRNNRGISPLRTKNNTSSSADSVAGSTTSSKRAVGFYIPGVNNGNKKSMEDVSGNHSAMGVSRAHSMLSSRPGGSKKYSEKTTTYAMAQPQRDQVEKDDEIYGSTTVIDYSKIDEEDENNYQKQQKSKKLKRTASLPNDSRFPWLFRRKKKDKVRVVNE